MVIQSDGTVDKNAFLQHFVSEYGFTQQEAQIVYQKWDLNRDGRISESEWANLNQQLQQAKVDARHRADMVNQQGNGCMVCCTVWGACCAWLWCACTMGISVCIFFCCFAGIMTANKQNEQIPEHAAMEAAKRKAIQGPPGTH